MDPRFDSSVNYLADPCTQINSPGVKLAISLSCMEKSKMMLTLLWLPQKLLLFPVHMRPELLDQDEWENDWLNERTDETETGIINRAACVGRRRRVTQEGSEMTILVKRQEEAQWCTCGGEIPALAEPQLERLKLFSQGKGILHLLCVILVCEGRKGVHWSLDVWFGSAKTNKNHLSPKAWQTHCYLQWYKTFTVLYPFLSCPCF